MLKELVELIFGSALFINGLLFVPQAINIIKEKSTKGISIVTFFGFLLIQFAVVMHGVMNDDYLLVAGYIFSIITCGTVVALILYYRNSPKHHCKKEQISFEEIIAQIPGYIYCNDKNGILLHCNSKTLDFLGLKSLHQYRGRTDYDLFPKEEADKFTKNDHDVMRTEQAKTVEEIATSFDGTVRLFLSNKVPLRDNLGKIIGVVGISLDITEEKKIITERIEMLENIIAMMPGHVYWVDKEGLYLGCNDNQAKSAGLVSRHEIVGKRNRDLPWNFTTDTLPNDLDNTNKQVIVTGNKITLEEPAILNDGKEIIFLSNKSPLRNKKQDIIGMVGISIDITELKKIEQALSLEKEISEAANKAKSEFLYNMRHDLVTPFSGILGMSEFMEQAEQDAKKKETLGYITQSARAFLDQLEQIFEFVHIESGQLPILEKQFDLHSALMDIIKMMLPSAKNKNLDLSITKSDDLPQYVIGDKTRLQRILINLLTNSIKFTAQGSIKLIVNLLHREDYKTIIKFVVVDTGIGIPEDKLDIVFEQFNRLTPAYKGVYPGKGLGLRMVKIFLDDINGQIRAHSSLGRGSTFEVKISFKQPILIEEVA